MINMTIDIATNILMQSIENPAFTVFSKIISYVFDPLTIVITLIIIGAYLYTKVSKKQGIFLASIIIITGMIIKISKEIFQRARPLNALMPDSGFSMPSGHATIIVVFFGLIIYLFIQKKYKIGASVTATLIILLIGFTRIYLRTHWLTDVLTGFLIGGIILITSIIIHKKFDFKKPF